MPKQVLFLLNNHFTHELREIASLFNWKEQEEKMLELYKGIEEDKNV